MARTDEPSFDSQPGADLESKEQRDLRNDLTALHAAADKRQQIVPPIERLAEQSRLPRTPLHLNDCRRSILQVWKRRPPHNSPRKRPHGVPLLPRRFAPLRVCLLRGPRAIYESSVFQFQVTAQGDFKRPLL